MDDLKAIIRRAKYDAAAENQEMIIGRKGDHWYTVPKDDPASDSVKPGIIVDSDGVKYPDHQDLVDRILSGREESG
ncbi:MAG: hypothetical protein ACLFTB_06585 [Desulfovibrionales bacterium]